MKAILALALLALPLAACAQTAAARPGSGVSRSTATVTIAIGGRATVNGLSIRPLRVIEDSRCPMDATCVWRGRLRVEVALRGRSGAWIIVLEDSKPLAANGGHLTLIGSVPAPRADAPRPKTFIFRFERG